MQDLEHKLGNFKEAKRNYEEEVVQCLVWVSIFDIQTLWEIVNQKDIKIFLS
jgi:hypothetical protein